MLGFLPRVFSSRCMKNMPSARLFNLFPGSTPRNTHRPRRGFLSFPHPLAVLFPMSCLCQCASTRGKRRGEQMTWLSGSQRGNSAEPGMTTENGQHKPCLSEEAAELWLQQMSYRLCDDMGSVLNIAYTFHLLYSPVCVVTSFLGPKCLLHNWNPICGEGAAFTSQLIGSSHFLSCICILAADISSE